jgi:uncharacterized protein (TIGR02145 family)
MNTFFSLRVYPFLLMLGILISLPSCDDDDNDEPEPDPEPLNIDIVRGSVEDIDGNVYETVTIGNQEWMAENLRTTRYNNGMDIAYPGNDAAAWTNNTTGAYGWYNNNEATNKDIFGAIYNWHAVNNASGICPTGWRIPTRHDWEQLEDYLRVEYSLSNSHGGVGSVGNRLKSCRQVRSPMGSGCATSLNPRWAEHDTHYGFDDFGFAAIPIGSRNSEGTFIGNAGYYGQYWSANADGEEQAVYTYFTYDIGAMLRTSGSKLNGYAVRCVR